MKFAQVLADKQANDAARVHVSTNCGIEHTKSLTYLLDPVLQVSVRKAALTAARRLLEAAPLDASVAQLWLGIAAPMVR